MSLFQPDPNETLLLNSVVMWNSSKLLAFPGDLFITNRRLVFEKHLTPGANAISAWMIKSYRPRIVCDVPLKEIAKITLTKRLIGDRRKVQFEFNNKTLTISPDNWEDILNLMPPTVQVVEE